MCFIDRRTSFAREIAQVVDPSLFLKAKSVYASIYFSFAVFVSHILYRPMSVLPPHSNPTRTRLRRQSTPRGQTPTAAAAATAAEDGIAVEVQSEAAAAAAVAPEATPPANQSRSRSRSRRRSSGCAPNKRRGKRWASITRLCRQQSEAHTCVPKLGTRASLALSEPWGGLVFLSA